MHSLKFVNTLRAGGSGKTERYYLDFFVSEQPLKKLLGIEGSDSISPFGWINNPKYIKSIIKAFALKEKTRATLYVCPECADVECGVFTVEVQENEDKIVWKNFGYGEMPEEYLEVEPIEFDKQNYFEAIYTVNAYA